MNDNITSAPRAAARTNPADTSNLSEAEFLQRETHQAHEAIAQSIEGLKESLGTAADLRLWAQHHPWLTVGAAAAAGFAVGSTIGSAGQGEAEPVPSNGHPGAEAATTPRATRGQSSSMWGSLMGPLFDLAKVAIQTSIASAMGGAMHAQAQEQANQERAEEAMAGPSHPL